MCVRPCVCKCMVFPCAGAHACMCMHLELEVSLRFHWDGVFLFLWSSLAQTGGLQQQASGEQKFSCLHFPRSGITGTCHYASMPDFSMCILRRLNSDLHPCVVRTLPPYPEIAASDLPFAFFLWIFVLRVTHKVKGDWQSAPASSVCLFYFLEPRALVRAVPVTVMSEQHLW